MDDQLLPDYTCGDCQAPLDEPDYICTNGCDSWVEVHGWAATLHQFYFWKKSYMHNWEHMEWNYRRKFLDQLRAFDRTRSSHLIESSSF